MKNKHYEVILMIILFLTPPYLQATEVTSTINFTGSALSIATNTNWVADTIDITAPSEVHYDMYMYVNNTLTATGMGRLAYGYGAGSLNVTTNTPWVMDTIGMTTTGAADRSVLDQSINSTPDGTSIGRNALYIGDGSITTSSAYNGFNVPQGEASVTGIYLNGNNYGVLIQRPLEFNAGFGGMRESVAAAGGNPSNPYSVQQFGYVDVDGSGNFNLTNDHRVFMGVTGDQSATITSTNFGSFPQPGPDVFRANITSWAIGNGAYSFGAESPVMQGYDTFNFGFGTTGTLVNSDVFEISAGFSANH